MRDLPADLVDILNPPLRALYNKLASKLTNLSDFQISRLSDEELFNLIQDRFSNLSEAESQRIINAFVEPLISFLFPRSIPIPKDEGMSRYMTLLEQQDHLVYHQSSLNLGNIFFWGLVGFASLVGFALFQARQLVLTRNYGYDIAIDHTAQEQLKVSKRSHSLLPKSKSATSAIVPKGQGLKSIGELYIRETNLVLRGIGEPYIRETDLVLRQEVEQQQEGASRAVVRSNRSTDDDFLGEDEEGEYHEDRVLDFLDKEEEVDDPRVLLLAGE